MYREPRGRKPAAIGVSEQERAHPPSETGHCQSRSGSLSLVPLRHGCRLAGAVPTTLGGTSDSGHLLPVSGFDAPSRPPGD